MRKNETNVSLVLACMYLCMGIIQPGQLHANPYATGGVGAPGRLQNLPVIEVSALWEHHLIVPQASEQLLVVTHLTPGETYSLRVPADPASGGCMPQVAVEGQAPAMLHVDSGARTLTFVAEETSLSFRLSYPCAWGDPKYPRRHYVSITCATCLQEAPSAEKVSSSALLQVTPGVNPDSVIRNVFIGNSCFDVQNVTFSGQTHQLGTFSNGQTNIGIASGVIISTSPADYAIGPNNSVGAEVPLPLVVTPDADLALLPGVGAAKLYDLAILEFEFTPTVSQVTFDFVFASEEYCEWVGSQFNDVFGFFISGPGIPGNQNIAVLPNTSTPISINSINHQLNDNYYIHNIGSMSNINPPRPIEYITCPPPVPGGPVPYSNAPAVGETQFDGFTVTLTAIANVIPCETYHIQLKITDVSDNLLPSAVFLRAGSFNAGGIAAPKWVVNNVPDAAGTTEDCDVVELVFERVGGGTAELIVPLLISGTATPNVDYGAIPNPVVIPANASSVTIPVPIYSDQTLEGDETIIVRLVDSCECSNPQRTLLIEDFSPAILGAPVFLAPGGTADISVNGVYSAYLWAPGGETDPQINVPAGTYTVTVTNGAGCTASASVSIAGCDLVVTTTADSGPGSLREAIECANSNPNADVITFNLPGGAPYSIALDAPLPVVSESVTIDATSQPGWSFGDVQLFPNDPAAFSAGLVFTASSCAMRGIWAGSFINGVGVQVNTAHAFTMTDCIVSDCEVGVQTGGDCNFLIDDCIIAYNTLAGIDAGIAEKVQVRRNIMFCNGTDPGGDAFAPSFGSAPPPVITSATPTQISGTATYLPPLPTFPENIVEVFTTGDPACPDADVQGNAFLASAVVNPDNTWSVTGNFPAGAILTATVTNPAACVVPPCGIWTIGFDSYVVPGTTNVEFYGNTTGNPTEWYWDFGDGATSDQQSPVHTFADYGVYEVCLTVFDSVCNEAFITCQDICNLVPDFDYNVNPANYRDVQFTDLSLGSPTNWFWEFGDGGTDNVQNPAYLYDPGFGMQLLHLVIEKDNCQEELYTFIDIAGCNIDIDFDWLVTPPFDVQFNDLSSGSPTFWYWDFGDGDFSFQQGPAHTYPGNGTYDVYLEIAKDVVANGDNVTCQIWTERQIQFLAPCDTLSANYYIETPGDGCTVEFYDISAGNPVAWYWDFGDGNTSTLQNPTHTYTTSDDFVVCLEVYSTDSLCQTSVCYLVGPNCTLLEAATSDFSLATCVDFPVTAGSNSPLCAGTAINLTNTPGGGTSPYTFSWEGPSGYTSMDENPVIPNATPARSGTYTVTVTDVNGCTGTAEVSVTVHPLPIAGILGDLAYCAGSNTELTATGGPSYLWEDNSMAAVHLVTAGVYTVTVTSGDGCSASASVTVLELGLVVTTTADSGPGSLRQAIECANSQPGPDVITFNIPGGAPYEIILNTPLPVVSESVYIDATSQPGWSFGDILLFPDNPAGFSAGLEFAASECEVHGLVVRGFDEGIGVRSTPPISLRSQTALWTNVRWAYKLLANVTS
ncbi:MAG: choice-of-anchor L domain-containing protein [Lewinellaceae bacterium]|nr:choice-of-anchor L domain-containing protein [Lewinellaceae bacterium]